MSNNNILSQNIAHITVKGTTAASTGKTVFLNSLLNRDNISSFDQIVHHPLATSKLYISNQHIDTLHLNFYIKREGIDNTKINEFSKESKVHIIVYDVTNRESYEGAKLIGQTNLSGAPSGFKEHEPIALIAIGMKCDLKDKRVVSRLEGRALTTSTIGYHSQFDISDRTCPPATRDAIFHLIIKLFNKDRLHTIHNYNKLNINCIKRHSLSTNPPPSYLSTSLFGGASSSITTSTTLFGGELSSTTSSSLFEGIETTTTEDSSELFSTTTSSSREITTIGGDVPLQDISLLPLFKRVFGYKIIAKHIFRMVRKIHRCLGLRSARLRIPDPQVWFSSPQLAPMIKYRIKHGYPRIAIKENSFEFQSFLHTNNDFDLFKQCYQEDIQRFTNMSFSANSSIKNHNSILIDACIGGSVEIVDFLIEQDYDVTEREFMLAVAFGHFNLVTYMIDNCRILEYSNPKGVIKDALIIARHYQHDNLVSYLESIHIAPAPPEQTIMPDIYMIALKDSIQKLPSSSSDVTLEIKRQRLYKKQKTKEQKDKKRIYNYK
ncbi:hypothetical protein DFA_04954 [Cavenderia fasciculata]|uniref:Uncharacterized protein n=1 Tax=Cavenderia fasciculata TaxID=261658 RepID=F4PMM7_CACFS|nr:uncharacterized protein DFA_04954 [Cavenderia fasciculata]EGG22824.1 hypothetical protein DFA_04954 [Cavenderia fasciculata]|eukprot:XP_004360675.1 hypothetical protein DFA_04954 [Cavenderia fasciculata]